MNQIPNNKPAQKQIQLLNSLMQKIDTHNNKLLMNKATNKNIVVL